MDDLVEQPVAYRCKRDCERDTLKDRIGELEAQVAALRAVVAVKEDLLAALAKLENPDA